MRAINNNNAISPATGIAGHLSKHIVSVFASQTSDGIIVQCRTSGQYIWTSNKGYDHS